VEKIRTLFERDPLTRKVVDDRVMPLLDLVGGTVTEMVDGTNVRLTVRSGELVRIEARRNPTKPQKEKGIVEPWYRDAYVYGLDAAALADQHIVEAAENTDLTGVPDGEWSGEAVGPAIQGNPLELDPGEVILFSVPYVRLRRLTFASSHVPGLEFDVLRGWLAATDSLVSPGHPIEGIVIWKGDRPIAKLKAKDFA
jgi:hypothetical protein